MIFTPTTHCIRTKKAPAAYALAKQQNKICTRTAHCIRIKKQTLAAYALAKQERNELYPNNALYPKGKIACGVRTAKKKRKYIPQRIVSERKNLYLKRKRLRRTHRPKTKRTIKTKLWITELWMT